MVLMISDARPRIAAAKLAESLRDASASTGSYQLEWHVIEGVLDLRFAAVTRTIDISHCEFKGTVDLRNAAFDGTVLFRDCRFRGEVNAGDEDLSYTTFKADLRFDDSVFESFVSFIGFHCEASASFRRCRFEATSIREGATGPRRPVEFSGGKVGMEFTLSGSVFRGCASFNALRCDLAGFFHDTRFESRDSLVVDFVASSYGVVCELNRAVFAGAADLTGITCGLLLIIDLARFCHPEHLASFGNSKTDFFCARRGVRGPDHAGWAAL